MPTPEVDFYYDIVSPYSFLAVSQIPRIEAESSAVVRYRPTFLGGIMKGANNQPPGLVAAKARYMSTDLKRWASRYGLDYKFPPHFPINTLKTMRVLVQLSGSELRDATARLFDAYWARGRNLSNEEVLKGELAAVFSEARVTQLLALAATDGVKGELRENTEEAVTRGAFGAPTFFVGTDMFFGNDRLDFLIEALQ